jgi:hypothetical protein
MKKGEPARPQSLPEMLRILATWLDQVALGADPIEVMHGHLCGPGCLHWDTMPAARKKKLMQAPWNVEQKKRRKKR